jgi:16S rRNA (guanine527-N7)-methyltransferase
MMDVGELRVAGVIVSRETFTALEDLKALVEKWNPAINLVSKATMDQLWDRHIVDSAQIFSVCPPNAQSWADLGSGGGFPGLVVAAIAREKMPEMRVALVESDLRKATFLRQAIRSLGLQAVVHNERIESVEPLLADVVSARALAALPSLLGYAHRHVSAGGVSILPKGARHQEELEQARAAWTFDVDTQPSLSDPEAAILLIRNIQRAVQ